MLRASGDVLRPVRSRRIGPIFGPPSLNLTRVGSSCRSVGRTLSAWLRCCDSHTALHAETARFLSRNSRFSARRPAKPPRLASFANSLTGVPRPRLPRFCEPRSLSRARVSICDRRSATRRLVLATDCVPPLRGPQLDPLFQPPRRRPPLGCIPSRAATKRAAFSRYASRPGCARPRPSSRSVRLQLSSLRSGFASQTKRFATSSLRFLGVFLIRPLRSRLRATSYLVR